MLKLQREREREEASVRAMLGSETSERGFEA